MVNFLSEFLNINILAFGGLALMAETLCPALGLTFLLAGVTKLLFFTLETTVIDIAKRLNFSRHKQLA